MKAEKAAAASDGTPDLELEIHVPISPTPVFFNRVHYLAASLQVYGDELRDSRIVVTVGADEEPDDLRERLRWSRDYPIEWRWLERELFREYSYFGTRVKRFTYEFDARHVMMLDADVLVVGSFADLIRRVATSNVFAGITAHVSPIRDGLTWEKLFDAAGLGAVPYVCEHSGFGLMYHDPDKRFCPPYFNLGVLVAPREHMERIGRTIFAELDIVRRLESFFRGQMSVTLAIQRHGIPWSVMPVKYNFPNDQLFVARYPHDFADMRLVHFLRKDQFDKDADFESPERLSSLLRRRDWSEVNEAFFRRLAPVHRRVLSDTRRAAGRRIWRAVRSALWPAPSQ